MDKIKLSDINLPSLEKCKIQGTKSTVYENGNECIKILDRLYPSEKQDLYRKFLDMDGITISGVLLPISLIVENDTLYGYTMKNFKNSINLNDYFASTRYVNCADILKVIKRASLILRDIHSKEIIYQDLSFDNILIDKDGNIMFSDIDGCKYKEHRTQFISVLLKSLINDYRRELVYISENLDRISMMISMFYLMYLKEVQKLSKKEYHSLSDNIRTLDNCREYANILVDRSNMLSDIPYLDELIDDSDDFIIDRNKQLNLRQKLTNSWYNYVKGGI